MSSLATPLPLPVHIGGAFNIYSTRADSFDAGSVALAARFASYAATPIVNARGVRTVSRRLDQMGQAMVNRATIDQAKGILMERHNVDDEPRS